MSLREHLQEIYDQHGILTPQLVVEAARPKASPLHGLVYDRPPKEAADAWYRHRAHELIASVRVTYKKANGSEESVRAFHAVRRESGENGGYVYEPSDVIVSDPFLTKLVLSEMEREWKTLRTRYENFKEFWALVHNDAEEAAS